MREITLEEQKQIEFEILKYLRQICEKNNLKFFLAEGTLLGAVRHKGFIPWDDDIDVFMPYKDYIKLIDILSKETNDTYEILSPYNNDEYYYMFSKIVDKRTKLIEYGNKEIKKLGVYIDIFPIIKLPNTMSEREKYYKKLHRLSMFYARNNMLKHYWNSNSTKKKIMKAILFFPEHTYYCLSKKIIKYRDNILKLMKKFEKFEENKYEGYIQGIYGRKEIMRSEVYNELMEGEFEGENFPIPVLYDEYLTQIYGNYMELPPEEKRVSHHNYFAYWK